MKAIVLAVTSALCLFYNVGHAQSNEDISGGVIWESEPYMVVDPSNPQHLIVAWMGSAGSALNIKTITTFNGGATWSSPAVIPHQSPTFTSADVSIAFGHTGNLYATYIDFRKSPDSGAVYMVKSSDGGLTWSTPNQVISGFADGSKYPLDRPWLVVSPTGAVDTIYVTSKPAPWVAPPNRPYFVKSYDAGATWSAWRNIDSTGYLVGNVIQAPMAAPAIDSAGRFHCIYPAYLPSESIYPRYIMATNGPGNSFSYNIAETITASAGTIDTLAKAGGKFICDPAHNGHFAFVHLENKYGDLDIFSIETTDGGVTWSAPVRVNDDAAGNGKMQDMAWANFDENGDLVTAWRDRRNAPGTGYEQPTEMWGAIKWFDSSAFSANFKISDTAAPYDSVYLYGAGNDFMNVAMAQDTLSAVWGDVRTGALNIWFSRRAMRTGVTTMVKNIATEQMPGVNIYPNPGSQHIVIEGGGMTEIVLNDLAGKVILKKKIDAARYVLDVSGVVPGEYIAVINTQNGMITRKIEIR